MAKWDDFIAELLNKTDLVSLVGKYVALNKKGATYWGCCPFHHERTPSFTVSENKGMFYCFGCHAGGNAINFLSKIESVPRFEAIKILAESARLTVPEEEGRKKEGYEETQKKRLRQLSLLKDAAIHYHQNLFLDSLNINSSNLNSSKNFNNTQNNFENAVKAGNLAAIYLLKRGIGKDMITRFGIGYSLGYDDVILYLKAKGYSNQEVIDAGVGAQKADKLYDVFFKRLIIPIIDQRGDVIAFGGRLLEDADFAKYRNSSQSMVFDKSRTIFAINLLKRKKQKEGLKQIILAEGYMDVIALHKAGFTEAVASMGTALTRQQAKALKNLCDNVYISYDGDSAGQKATLKGLDILNSEGLNVKVIMLPDGLDPDDVINRYGASEYKRLMENALPLPAFKIESLKKAHDLTAPDSKSAFAVEAVNVVKTLPNPVEREEYLKLIHEATGYTMNVLYAQADLAQPEAAFQPPASALISPQSALEGAGIAGAGAGGAGLTEAKEFILAEIAADKPYADLNEDIYTILGDDESRRLFLIISEARKQAGYSLGYLCEFVDEEDAPLIDRLINYLYKDGDNAQKYTDCVNKLKIDKLTAEQNEVVAEYNQNKDPKLILTVQRLTHQINQLKKK